MVALFDREDGNVTEILWLCGGTAAKVFLDYSASLEGVLVISVLTSGLFIRE